MNSTLRCRSSTRAITCPSCRSRGGQDRPGPQALVLRVAGKSRIFSGHRGQIGSNVGNRLHAWFFVHRNRNHRGAASAFPEDLILHFHFAIDQEYFSHLLLQLRIPSFQIVLHLVRLQGLGSENALDGGFPGLGQGWVASLGSFLPYMPGQSRARP